MKSFIKSISVYFLVFFFFPASLISQNFEDFQKNVLVDIPGDNYDFDLPADGIMYPVDKSSITWVNNSGSTYTIYFKMLTSESTDTNIVISSGNIIKSNPQIAMNSSGPGFSIFWQNFTGSFYQIIRRDFYGDSLSSEVILKDSLSEDPQITTSYNFLALIMDDSLYVKVLSPDTVGVIYIDGPGCSSPSINTYWEWSTNDLIYEKLVNGDRHIYLAEYNSHTSQWYPHEISDGDNRNPVFGLSCGFAFESIENGLSRIKYLDFYHEPQFELLTTENISCNYKNPDILTYDIPINRPDEDTPFFITFDTDSLENNSEVLINTFFFGAYDTLINLSDMEGNDFRPKIDLMNIGGVDYLVIVWEHNNGMHNTLWIAKTIFHPAGGVKKDENYLSSFELLQNYPNPFNPSTNIDYLLKYGADVKITVFDILGNRVSTLVDRYENAGHFNVLFDGKNLSSGVYFYTIEVNRLQKTKAMILMK